MPPDRIAELIADRLFTNGAQEHAQRLVLTIDTPYPRNLGGWCEAAAVDQIEKVLTDVGGLLPATAEPDRLQLIGGQSVDRLKAMGGLNTDQRQAVRNWAADDRLWTTQETVEINLATFARLILALPAQAPRGET